MKNNIWKIGIVIVSTIAFVLVICCCMVKDGAYAVEAGQEIDSEILTETEETTEEEKPVLLQKVPIKQVVPKYDKVTVKWKKSTDEISGYQVAYATQKDILSESLIKKKVDSKKTSFTIKKLNPGKTYYIWVRTYSNIEGKRKYSEWSSAKSVKTLKYLVAIDAGHQKVANTGKEPNGPGSKNMKMKVTGGTQGRFTGQTEYELNLAVAKKLKKVLKKRGYEVLMIRESNDVNISNVERAQIANKAGADAFIRIHANGSDNANTNGAMTICQTSKNPYCKSTYKKSKKLSVCVLDQVVKSTGCKREKVWETDTMTGINWCEIPVTIIEMGYLSNRDEDTLLATDSYRTKMANGIADGIDEFFGLD